MKAVKFLVASAATLSVVVAVGCSHTKTDTTSRSMYNQDRVATREATREVVTTKSEDPVVVRDNSPVTTYAPAPIARTEPATAPAMPERVAKADRG